MKADLIEQMMASPRLPEMLQALNQKWEEEQRRRHQFWADIRDDVKAEYINGRVVYHSPVRKIHNVVHFNLILTIGGYVKEKKLGFLGFEKVMTRFTRNDYEPDLCFWKHEKAREFTDDQTVFPVPDFIVEIFSRSTAATDRGIKLQDYARHGVTEYWIIDPGQKIVEQYLLTAHSYNPPLKLKTGRLVSTVIEGLTVTVEELFA